MNKFFRIRWLRIFAWIMAFALFALVVWIVDISFLRNRPLIFVSNYSDIVVAIWEIQTTISSLTLASAAFILGKIEDSYYGISIKNLLHLSRHFPQYELSFWEKVLCSIILPITTWLFVVLDNITAVSFLLLFTLYLSVSILFECINVITKSEIYSEWAKKVVDQLVDTIVTDDEKADKNERKKAQDHLCLVIDGIGTEVSSEIKRGVKLLDSNTYTYFIRLLHRYDDSGRNPVTDQMHNTLNEWLILAIGEKSEQNIRTLLWASYSESLNSRWCATGINTFMYSYYHGDISASCFQQEINRVSKKILQASDDYSATALYVLRNAIDFADVTTFVNIIKAVWRSTPYSNPLIKSNVLITTITYLYYVSHKEQYIPIERGFDYLEKLRLFPSATILETYKNPNPRTIKDILSDTELIINGAAFLLDFFNDRAFNWEYIPLGEAKSARLGNDTIEFLTFYCYLFFSDIRKENLEPISLEVLLKMKTYLNIEGNISENHYTEYVVFCEWLGIGEKSDQSNDWFYISLIEAIKEKMVAEAIEIRQNRKIWSSKISDLKTNVVDELSKSALCLDSDSTEAASINLRLCDFHLLKDFSEHCFLHGVEQSVIDICESNLFATLLKRKMLASCAVHQTLSGFNESFLSFIDMRQQMLEHGVRINKYYNLAFFNLFSHRPSASSISDKIKVLDNSMEYAGQWETGYSGISVYVDSHLDKIGFCVPDENFMTVYETLTDTELRYYAQTYKTENGYMFKEASNSVEVPFSEDELIEYLRIAMVKIRYVFPVLLPRHKVGFFTYYTK